MNWLDEFRTETPKQAPDRTDKTLLKNLHTPKTGTSPTDRTDKTNGAGIDWVLDIRSLSPEELAELEITFTVPAPGSDGWTVDDWVEWTNERSAILEIDGGVPSETADAQAVILLSAVFRHRRRKTSDGL
jgi:hypothetical protein